MSTLKPCAHCGGKASVRRDADPEFGPWYHVECNRCGLRTRGKYVSSSSNTCPIFYEEVRNRWNQRPSDTRRTFELAQLVERLEAVDPSGEQARAIINHLGREYSEITNGKEG